MNKPRVLHELFLALDGYAGIPQEVRIIFNMLSQSDTLNLDGFFFSHNRGIAPIEINPNQSKYEAILNTNFFLHDALNHTFDLSLLEKIRNKLFKPFKPFIKSPGESKRNAAKNWGLHPIDPCFRDVLWRALFKKSIALSEKERIIQHNFYYSNLVWQDVRQGMRQNYPLNLDTKGYDFVVFPSCRPIKVSPNTKKIVRYHDAFPLICPDFFSEDDLHVHLQSLKASKDDSFFVCNSEYTRDTLLCVYPELEKKSTVIQPAKLPYQPKLDLNALKNILLSYTSQRILGDKTASTVAATVDKDFPFDYILSLATLEPRKNYINLIKAWEKFCYQHNQDVKLVIVANPGWYSEDIERCMRPYMETGKIIHLVNVPPDETAILFSHAKLFVTASYQEGFGYPPIEAMQCDCPVLASNNPAHLWAMGDAAEYCDPYDIDSIVDGMAKMLCLPGADELRASYVKKGREQVIHSTPEVVKTKWEELFATLSTK